MLEITVEPITMFNQETQEFVAVGPKKPVKLHLEHSLISLSKWEEQTRRKFFSKEECPQTKEDYLFYIKCMSLDGPIKDDILTAITNSQLIEIINYIQSDRSATTIEVQNIRPRSLRRNFFIIILLFFTFLFLLKNGIYHGY